MRPIVEARFFAGIVEDRAEAPVGPEHRNAKLGIRGNVAKYREIVCVERITNRVSGGHVETRVGEADVADRSRNACGSRPCDGKITPSTSARIVAVHEVVEREIEDAGNDAQQCGPFCHGRASTNVGRQRIAARRNELRWKRIFRLTFDQQCEDVLDTGTLCELFDLTIDPS